MKPHSPIACIASATILLSAMYVEQAISQLPDDSRLRQIAGQAPSYADEVRGLLASGADPNVPDSAGRTAVHAAARIGATETLEALLKAGGNPDARDEDGNTPLHFASYAPSAELTVLDSISAIVLLLKDGAEAGSINAEGRTPLHVAAGSHDQPGGVAALLRAGANPNRKDGNESTPLHAAVGPNLGWPGVVETLLDGGADPEMVNRAGLTALQLFVRAAPDQGDTAVALLDAGAGPDRTYPNGDAPLHAAIRSGGSRGKVAVAEALLAGGANPCVRDTEQTIPYQIAPEEGAIRRALDRAGGHELACDRQDAQVGPAVVAAGRVMQVRTRSNLRSGPGTKYDKVGLLEPGDAVRVTGEAGEWLRIEGPQGGEAFIYASLLTEIERAGAPEPACAGQDEGASCWKKIVDRLGCHVWVHHFSPASTVSWSGRCVDGIAHGEGTLAWTRDGRTAFEQTGGLNRGKHHGGWTQRSTDGTVIEAHLVDGVPSGTFAIRHRGGIDSAACEADDLERGYCRVQRIIEHGAMSDGARNGYWTERICWVCQQDDGPSLAVYDTEGPYVNGEKTGHWVEKAMTGPLAGDVDEGSYVDGKKHGNWIEQFQMSRWNTDGYAAIWEGPYVDDERNGRWTVRVNDGLVEEGPLVDGEKHGQWIEREPDGRCRKIEYTRGEHGQTTEC